MTFSAFIKKRNEEFVNKFQRPYKADWYYDHNELFDFHTASLTLFAEELKKEIERMKKPVTNRFASMPKEYNQALSDLAKKLEL